MSLMEKLFNDNGVSNDDYIEVTDDDFEQEVNTDREMHIAKIENHDDILSIKNALYDDDIVIADIRHIESNGLSIERVRNELRSIIGETNGDIVQHKSQYILLTPRDISISRDVLNED